MRATITSTIPILIAFGAGAMVLTRYWWAAVPVGCLAVIGAWYEVYVLRKQVVGLMSALDQVMREKGQKAR